jgi:hypothetical protein
LRSYVDKKHEEYCKEFRKYNVISFKEEERDRMVVEMSQKTEWSQDMKGKSNAKSVVLPEEPDVFIINCYYYYLLLLLGCV